MPLISKDTATEIANDPLYALCRAFIEKHRVSCPEATAEDRIYEHAPELVEEIAKVVGFYRYPDEEAA